MLSYCDLNTNTLTWGTPRSYIFKTGDGEIVTNCTNPGLESNSRFFQGDVIASRPDKKAAVWIDQIGDLHCGDFESNEDWILSDEEDNLASITLGDVKEFLDIASTLDIGCGIADIWKYISQYIE